MKIKNEYKHVIGGILLSLTAIVMGIKCSSIAALALMIGWELHSYRTYLAQLEKKEKINKAVLIAHIKDTVLDLFYGVMGLLAGTIALVMLNIIQ